MEVQIFGLCETMMARKFEPKKSVFHKNSLSLPILTKKWKRKKIDFWNWIEVKKKKKKKEGLKMVKVATYFGMSLAAFVFWQSMDKVHVWIALHQDEKVISAFLLRILHLLIKIQFLLFIFSQFPYSISISLFLFMY